MRGILFLFGGIINEILNFGLCKLFKQKIKIPNVLLPLKIPEVTLPTTQIGGNNENTYSQYCNPFYYKQNSVNGLVDPIIQALSYIISFYLISQKTDIKAISYIVIIITAIIIVLTRHLLVCQNYKNMAFGCIIGLIFGYLYFKIIQKDYIL